MGRTGPKILEDLVIPSLGCKVFGRRLFWENEQELILNILWRHKSNSHWTPADHEVFRKWDELKGRKTTGKDYYMESKGRFRSALRKINTVIELKSTREGYKQFQIVRDQKKKKKRKDDQVVRDENPSSSELSFYRDSLRECTTDLIVNIITQENENCNDIGNLNNFDWEMPPSVDWNELLNAESEQESKSGAMEEHSVPAIDWDPKLDYSYEPATDLEFFDRSAPL